VRLAVAIAAVLVLGGCESDAPSSTVSDAPPGSASDTRSAADPPPPTAADGPPRTAPLRPAHCPPDLANCRTASGRILYVERVDPDGDGDAHFVLISRQAITLPGVSVIDVAKSLRPHPLPGPGDRISAAGPVYRGSYGQKQIQALELHVARAR
jgi:hypothetical protein